MADKSKSMIVLVVDTSGSMRHNQRSFRATNGVNELIRKQTDGTHTVVKLVEFSSNVKTVEKNTRIEDVKKYHMVPDGGTRLFDGLGVAITDTKKYITKMSHNRRPSLVSFYIMTDGYENYSRDYYIPGFASLDTSFSIKPRKDAKDIREVVAAAKKDGWLFTLMGEGQTSSVGRELGIEESHSYAHGKDAEVYLAASSKLTRNKKQLIDGLMVDNSYTKDEIGLFS